MTSKHGLLVLVVTAMAGCAMQGPLSAEMAGWQGDNVSVALEAWGAPEDERAFGDETVLIWRDRAPLYLPPAGLGEPGRQPVLCERMLAVANDGTITGWRWRGDACGEVGARERSRTLAASR